jgi:hypothetical protein
MNLDQCTETISTNILLLMFLTFYVVLVSRNFMNGRVSFSVQCHK